MNIAIISDHREMLLFMGDFLLSSGYLKKHDFSFFRSTNKLEDLPGFFGHIEHVDFSSSILIDDFIKKFELIVSLHCNAIFPKKLVNNVRCINIHPGFNPYNRGMYPHVFSLINQKPVGVTIHEMSEKIDEGMIIFRQDVDIETVDTSTSLYLKILELEKEIIAKHFSDIIEKNYTAFKDVNNSNYNSKADFQRLCELDLNHKGTFWEHIKILKALSHDSYNNAFFLDEKGKKIYLKLDLTYEDLASSK